VLAGHGVVVTARAAAVTELTGWAMHRDRRVQTRTATKNQLLGQLDRCFPGLSLVLPDVLPPMGLGPFADSVVEWEREDPARRSLIDPPVQVRRVAGRLLRQVRRENDRVAPDGDRQIRHPRWTSWEIKAGSDHAPKLSRWQTLQECTIRRSTWTIL
jgi:hypothetical protein